MWYKVNEYMKYWRKMTRSRSMNGHRFQARCWYCMVNQAQLFLTIPLRLFLILSYVSCLIYMFGFLFSGACMSFHSQLMDLLVRMMNADYGGRRDVPAPLRLLYPTN